MTDHGQGKHSHGVGFYPTGAAFEIEMLAIAPPSFEWMFEDTLNLAARLPWYIRLWMWIRKQYNRNA